MFRTLPICPGGGGGGPQSVPSRISVVLVEEARAGGTPRLGCQCDDQRERQPARETVSDNSLGLPSVEGTLSHSRGPVLMLQMHQRCPVGCPCDDQRERQPARETVSDNSLGLPSVEGTLSHSGGPVLMLQMHQCCAVGGLSRFPHAGGTPRRECPLEDQDMQSLAGVTKLASVTVYDDGIGPPCVGGTLSSSVIAGRLLPAVLTGGSSPVGPIDPAGPNGPVIAGGPVGPDGTLSPFIRDHAGPAGRYVAIGPMGPFGMLSPPDCYSPGPTGPCIARRACVF